MKWRTTKSFKIDKGGVVAHFKQWCQLMNVCKDHVFTCKAYMIYFDDEDGYCVMAEINQSWEIIWFMNCLELCWAIISVLDTKKMWFLRGIFLVFMSGKLNTGDCLATPISSKADILNSKYVSFVLSLICFDCTFIFT
mgnify:CR=1 FL=1